MADDDSTPALTVIDSSTTPVYPGAAPMALVVKTEGGGQILLSIEAEKLPQLWACLQVVEGSLRPSGSSTTIRPMPPPLTWLERDTAYLLPPVLRHEGTATHGPGEPIRIRLRLEDGSLVAIPLRQDTIDGLADLMSRLATPKR